MLKPQMIFVLRLLLTLGFSAFVATGCSHKETAPSCATLDWYELGRADGSNGLAKKSFGKHSKRCEGETPDENQIQYSSGYNTGLISYCSASNGWYSGRSGQDYGKVCPKNLEPLFLKNYRIGRRVYSLEQQNDRLSAEINSINNQLRIERLDIGRKFQLTAQLEELINNKAGIVEKMSSIKNSIRFQ